MTQTQRPPLLVRQALFGARSEAALTKFFAALSRHDYPALRVFVHAGSEDLFLAGGVEFYEPHINRFIPTLRTAEGSPCPDLFKDLALSLQEDSEICEVLAEIDDIHMFSSHAGLYQLVMFCGCAIFSIANPVGWFQNRTEQTLQGPVARALQGVLVLPEVSSNHARAKQVSSALSALAVWDSMTPISISKQGQIYRSVFSSPRQVDILKSQARSLDESLRTETSLC